MGMVPTASGWNFTELATILLLAGVMLTALAPKKKPQRLRVKARK